jgi:hypothetical protein
MKPRLPGRYMRGPSRKVRDSNWRAMHGEAASASEVSTAAKTATMEAATTTEVTATATMEAATTEVAATATKTATMASATTAKSTSTSAAAVPSRRRGLTEGKQTEANNAKYSFCFHILSSR